MTYASSTVLDDVPVDDRGDRRYRHPSDVARLVFSLLVVGALLLVEFLTPSGVLSFGADVLRLVDGLPDRLVDGLVGLVQLGVAVAPIALVATLIARRRFDEVLVLGAAGVLAAVVMSLLAGLVDDSLPRSELGYDSVNSWFIGSQYPSASLLAALTAVLVAASPSLLRAQRVAGWSFILAAAVARIVTATEVPIRNGLLLAIGAAAGSTALVVFGAPRRRVGTASVADELRRAGVPVVDLVPRSSPDDVPVFVGRVPPERPVLVKALGRDQRDTDLLYGLWRSLTVKGLGTSAVLRSPMQAVQHEALAAGLFASAGARTVAPIAVAETRDEAAVLATDAPGGVPLDELDAVPDAVVADVWEQVARLQRRRFAHRNLHAGNLVVAADSVTLLDLRRADLAAGDETLGADVAEAAVTLALRVGPERALRPALASLGAERLARSAPLIQRSVFSRRTRAELDALEDPDAFLTGLRDACAEAAGVEHVELAEIQRITLGGAVSLVGSAVLVWYVLSIASDWDEIWDAFASAELIYVVPILLMTLATYFTGAMTLMGAVPIDLPLGRTTSVMVGQTYLNRFTPANSGGLAMRIRYLQKEGLDGSVAATAIGVTSAAGGVAQVIVIVVFLLWGGASDRFSDFRFPDVGPIVVALLVIGLIVSVVLATTWGRRVIRPWLTDAARKVTSTLHELASDTGKVTQLLGGAILTKLAQIVAFWLSTVAFDLGLSFPKAGAIYIIANTIGAAVPTPGGVGGIDAALTAALLSYGVDNAAAAAVVLLFRILTFWLPTLPGYVFLRHTRRAGIV